MPLQAPTAWIYISSKFSTPKITLSTPFIVSPPYRLAPQNTPLSHCKPHYCITPPYTAYPGTYATRKLTLFAFTRPTAYLHCHPLPQSTFSYTVSAVASNKGATVAYTRAVVSLSAVTSPMALPPYWARRKPVGKPNHEAKSVLVLIAHLTLPNTVRGEDTDKTAQLGGQWLAERPRKDR